MIRFDYEWHVQQIGNYRGCLEAKVDAGKFFARVDCDVDEERWVEIPQYLYDALSKFYYAKMQEREGREDGLPKTFAT